MKFYSKDGDVYTVESSGSNSNGTHYAICKNDDPIIDVVPMTNKLDVENKLAEMAKEEDLVPEIVWLIKTGNRILQGKQIQTNDFIKVDDTCIAESFKQYLAAKNKIGSLESEKKKEIENVKEEYADKIAAEEETLASIESIVRCGTIKEECFASWERDLSNGVMVLIRHDNLKPLQFRKMTEQELQVTIDDPEALPVDDSPEAGSNDDESLIDDDSSNEPDDLPDVE